MTQEESRARKVAIAMLGRGSKAWNDLKQSERNELLANAAERLYGVGWVVQNAQCGAELGAGKDL